MEGEQPDVDKDECANCHKRANSGEKAYRRCGDCKNAYYCSRECQKAHWKTGHRANCHRLREAKTVAAKSGQKRELRLLQEWRRQVKNATILPYMMLSFFGWKRLSSLQADQSVILLTVQFDYNKKNFVPTEEPSIVPIDVMPQFAEEMRQCYDSFPPAYKSQINFIVGILVEGMTIGAFMPFTGERPEQALTAATWTELQELLNEVKLESSKFRTWTALLQQNLKSVITSSVGRHAQFQPFLANALRIESKDSRHKTHVVVIDMEMGYGDF